MEHYAPHPGVAFEGYYSKFSLPSGALLVLIISAVPKAPTKSYVVSLTYVPSGDRKIFQKELLVDNIEMVRTGAHHAFELRVPGIGFVKCLPDSSTEYQIQHEDFTLQAQTTTHTPWSSAKSTPEGLLVYLPLPLHWHVHSLASRCAFRLQVRNLEDFPALDSEGTALVHQEKNWGLSFPNSHIWIQAYEGDRSLCLAGGEVLGLEAFLLGYRNKSLSVDFAPPFSMRVPGFFSPFLTADVDWDRRSVALSMQSFRQKIVVKALALEGSFFGLYGPFPDGHRENFLAESFRTNVTVELYESTWFGLGEWRLVALDRFEGASLEFGGAAYPLAGSQRRFN